MAKILIEHSVKDFNEWKPYFDNDATNRQSFGIQELAVFQDPEESNHIIMLFEVDDPSKVDAFLSRPELAETMEKAGVISKPKIFMA